MHEAIIRLELEPLEEGTIAEIRLVAEDLTRKLADTYIDYGQVLTPSMASVLADDTVIGFRVKVVSRKPFE